IDVRDQVALRYLLADVEHFAGQRRAVRVALHCRQMTRTYFGRKLCGTLVRAEQDDFGSWLQLRPTADRVALDRVKLTLERLGHRKDRQHVCTTILAGLEDSDSRGSATRLFRFAS